jgi:hypothetical protein
VYCRLIRLFPAPFAYDSVFLPLHRLIHRVCVSAEMAARVAPIELRKPDGVVNADVEEQMILRACATFFAVNNNGARGVTFVIYKSRDRPMLIDWFSIENYYPGMADEARRLHHALLRIWNGALGLPCHGHLHSVYIGSEAGL